MKNKKKLKVTIIDDKSLQSNSLHSIENNHIISEIEKLSSLDIEQYFPLFLKYNNGYNDTRYF
jgi:hypothetical protein